MSLMLRSTSARTTQRPMRPKPLMPILVAMMGTPPKGVLRRLLNLAGQARDRDASPKHFPGLAESETQLFQQIAHLVVGELGMKWHTQELAGGTLGFGKFGVPRAARVM